MKLVGQTGATAVPGIAGMGHMLGEQRTGSEVKGICQSVWGTQNQDGRECRSDFRVIIRAGRVIARPG